MAAINPPITGRQAQKNIFASPLKPVSAIKEKANLKFKKRNRIKAGIYMLFAVALLTAYSLMFFNEQLVAYLNFEQRIEEENEKVGNYEVTLPSLQQTRDFHKAAYDEEFKEEQDVIRAVFPENVDKLEVIRLFENFATHLAATSPPFEFNAISFGEPEKENGYTKLPFQTNIHASKSNFNRFLGLINLSGDIDPESKDHIRLFEISNISFRDKGVDKSGKELGVDFNVKLNAYSR